MATILPRFPSINFSPYSCNSLSIEHHKLCPGIAFSSYCPSIYVEAEAEKDPDDPSGFLVVVDESLLDDIPDHAKYEAVSALPVKAFPGLCYQAGWGSSLDKLTYGQKVRAEKSTLSALAM